MLYSLQRPVCPQHPITTGAHVLHILPAVQYKRDPTEEPGNDQTEANHSNQHAAHPNQHPVTFAKFRFHFRLKVDGSDYMKLGPSDFCFILGRSN